MKVGLVLEGGAIRGIYSAGVIDFLLDNNIKVDNIYGVSMGALVGVNYKSGQNKRTIRYNIKYLKDKRYISLYSLFKTGNIVNRNFAYYEIPYKLDKFDIDTYNKDKTKFTLVMTDVLSGKAIYKDISYIKSKKDMKYFIATSSMPIVSKIINIKDKLYLDGGLADSIPIQKALEECDKVIVVLTRVKGYKKKKSNMFLYNIVYRKYKNLLNTIKNRYINYNNTIDYIDKLESNKKIIVVRPSIDYKLKRLEKNLDKVNKQYELGYNDMKNKYDELLNYIKK